MNGITWKTHFWTQRTSILYNEREIGFFKMNFWRYKRATGMLLDREFKIKPINFWGTKIAIIDRIDERVIATLTINMWNNKTKLYVEKDNETFIFKQNMWSIGNWWWERELPKLQELEQLESSNKQQKQLIKNNDIAKPTEKLVQNRVANFLESKGEFNFGNTGESNLNALILGGIFVMTIRKQAASAVAAMGA